MWDVMERLVDVVMLGSATDEQQHRFRLQRRAERLKGGFIDIYVENDASWPWKGWPGYVKNDISTSPLLHIIKRSDGKAEFGVDGRVYVSEGSFEDVNNTATIESWPDWNVTDRQLARDASRITFVVDDDASDPKPTVTFVFEPLTSLLYG